jgi:hypothetical protein
MPCVSGHITSSGESVWNAAGGMSRDLEGTKYWRGLSIPLWRAGIPCFSKVLVEIRQNSYLVWRKTIHLGSNQDSKETSSNKDYKKDDEFLPFFPYRLVKHGSNKNGDFLAA